MKKQLLHFTLATLMLLLITSCGSTGKMASKKLLSSSTWELNSLKNRPIDTTAFRTGMPFLLFDKSGKLTGSTGCNNLSGSYKLSKSEFTLDPGAITKKTCQGNGEELFLRAIHYAKNMKIDANKLTLMNGANEIMTFIPKK
ncbi:MAG: META domain-containing protein [Bacteroidota bacterium]